jgi:hypothetical protein
LFLLQWRSLTSPKSWKSGGFLPNVLAGYARFGKHNYGQPQACHSKVKVFFDGSKKAFFNYYQNDRKARPLSVTGLALR